VTLTRKNGPSWSRRRRRLQHYQQAVPITREVLDLLALAGIRYRSFVVVSAPRGDPILSHFAVRPGPHRGGHTRGHADGSLGQPWPSGRGFCAYVRRPSSPSWWPSRSWLESTYVLCSDKTGTLDPEQAHPGRSLHRRRQSRQSSVIVAGALASRAEDNDTIDLAVLGGLSDGHGARRIRGRAFPAVRPGEQAHGVSRHRRRRTPRSRSPRARRRSSWSSRNAGEVRSAVDDAVGVRETGARYRSLGVARAEGAWPGAVPRCAAPL